MSKLLLLSCLLLSTQTLANDVNQTCWNGHATLEVWLDDQNILRGEYSAASFHYVIHASPTGSKALPVSVNITICRKSQCTQSSATHYVDAAHGLDIEYSANLSPPIQYNTIGTDHDTFRISIPQLQCDVTATNDVNVR